MALFLMYPEVGSMHIEFSFFETEPPLTSSLGVMFCQGSAPVPFVCVVFGQVIGRGLYGWSPSRRSCLPRAVQTQPQSSPPRFSLSLLVFVHIGHVGF